MAISSFCSELSRSYRVESSQRMCGNHSITLGNEFSSGLQAERMRLTLIK